MNTIELKYVVETAICGSINGAAKKLFVSQSNISRAIKNLELEYGIKIFQRSSQGVILTRDGQRFVEQSRQILREVDNLDSQMADKGKEKVELKISIPRASYASYAFVNYIKKMKQVQQIKIHVKECNSLEALDNLLMHDYHLALIRFNRKDEEHYHSILRAKSLKYEEIMEYQYRLLVNMRSPLAQMELNGYDDLKGFTEIIHGDIRLPNGEYADIMDSPENINSEKRIHVYERGSQFSLLRGIETTYMWVSPMPPDILQLYGLVQRECGWQKKWMKDVIIYPEKKILVRDAAVFIEELKREKEEVFKT